VTIPANLFNADHDSTIVAVRRRDSGHRNVKASGVLMAGPHVTTNSSGVSLSDHQLASPTVKYHHSIFPCLGESVEKPGGWLTSIRSQGEEEPLGHTCGTPRLRLTVPGTRARYNEAGSLISKRDPSERGWLSKRAAASGMLQIGPFRAR
jgi:hypothetical protein